jgi:hypothetical protein
MIAYVIFLGRGPSRDRRKSLLRVNQQENNEKAQDHPKGPVRIPTKKALESQKKASASATKRNDQNEKGECGFKPMRVLSYEPAIVTEPAVEDFLEDVGSIIENKGPVLQQNPLAELVPVDQIGVVPIRDNGKRMLKYMYNGHTRWVELPTPKYGRSLGDILPAEIQREPWMELVRHPLTWDGIERKCLYQNTFHL